MSSAMRTNEHTRKIWLLAGIIAIALVFFVFYYDPSLESWRLERFKLSLKVHWDDASVSWNATTKKILFWNTMFGDSTFYFGTGDLFRKCPDVGKNCWATHERSHVNVEDFDAVLFHGNDLSSLDIPPTRRGPQYYVFVNLESPENRPISDRWADDNFFNLTMTYRLDSDVPWPYAYVRKFEDNSIVAPRLETVWNRRPAEATDLKDTSPGAVRSTWNESTMMKTQKKKTKTAIWFVSNCRSQSGREKYVDELAAHVDVDIYGLCGNEVRCSKNQDCFREVVEPNYYFYLSFENSMCQDYVTEKLYKALKYNVVPVVYGGANYSLFAPPRSYINALDFDSPRQLAIYLKELIAKPNEYEEYFEWKKSYEIVGSNGHTICQLCQYLQENNKTKSYSPLSAWYKSDKCPLQETLKNVPYLTKKHLNNLP